MRRSHVKCTVSTSYVCVCVCLCALVTINKSNCSFDWTQSQIFFIDVLKYGSERGINYKDISDKFRYSKRENCHFLCDQNSNSSSSSRYNNNDNITKFSANWIVMVLDSSHSFDFDFAFSGTAIGIALWYLFGAKHFCWSTIIVCVQPAATAATTTAIAMFYRLFELYF